MRNAAVIALVILGLASAPAWAADHYVHGYITQRGTYVAPYHATNPNHTRQDNYSARANINPYTGRAGTRSPD